HCSLK
ncbi:putative integral membrane family protein, partial [Chlamydia psittaci 84-8471/1]